MAAVRANLRVIQRSCKYPWKALAGGPGGIVKLQGCQQPRRLLNSFSVSSHITEANRQRVLTLAAVCRRTCHTLCIDHACTPTHPKEESGSSAPAVQTTVSSVESIDAVLDVFEQSRKEGVLRHVRLAAILDDLLLAASKSNPKADLLSNDRSRRFLDYIIRKAPDFTADAAVSCFCSCGKHHFRYYTLLFALCHTIVKKFPSIPIEKLDSIYWVLRQLKLPRESINISRVAASRVFSCTMNPTTTVRFNTATVSHLVHFTSLGGAWSKEYSAPLQSYVNARLSEFTPQDLFVLLETVTKQGAASELLSSVGEVAARWINTTTTSLDPSDLTRVCWSYGRALVYHQAFFEALHEKIVSTDKQFLTPRLLATVAWAFARVRFYSAPLMDHIAALALATLDNFEFSQNLSMMAYAFGYLNHPHQELLSAISEKMCSDRSFISNSHACHNIAWSCMATGVYPRKLLEHVLASNSYNREYSWNLLQLQLDTAVTVEHPELGIPGLSESQKKTRLISALTTTTSDYNHSRTLFERNVHNSLNKLVGGFLYISSEAFTSVGYSLDAEVLIGPNAKPVPIPRWWKYRKIDSVRKVLQGINQSDGLATSSATLDSFVSNLKSVETSQDCTTCGNGATSTSTLEAAGEDSVPVYDLLTDMESEQYKYYITLASDWAGLTQSPSQPMARRIAVEMDGPMHFAVNSRHLTGSTVLKRRQLTAMGWEVISIPYYEWEPLETDNEHANYLARKIFGN